jgi:hypothetical protein
MTTHTETPVIDRPIWPAKDPRPRCPKCHHRLNTQDEKCGFCAHCLRRKAGR